MSDLISRQNALNAFGLSEKTRKYGGDHSGYNTMMLYEIQDILEELPSVETERKTGKWILCDNQRQEDINSGNYMYTCTNCLRSDVHAKTQKVPYCWWCGAKMKGEEYG